MKKFPYPVDILNVLNRIDVNAAVKKAIDRISPSQLDTRIIESEYSDPFRILNSSLDVKQSGEASRMLSYMVLAISLFNGTHRSVKNIIPTVLFPSQIHEWELSSLHEQHRIQENALRKWKRKFVSSESKQTHLFTSNLLVLRRHASLYSSMYIEFDDEADMAYIMNPHPTLRVQVLEKLACFYCKRDLNVKYIPVKGGAITEFESLVLSLYFLWKCCTPNARLSSSLSLQNDFETARRTLITIANVFIRLIIAIPRVEDLKEKYPGLDIGKLLMEDVWIITSERLTKGDIKALFKKRRPYLIVHIARNKSKYLYKVKDDGSFERIDPHQAIQEEGYSARRKDDDSKQMQTKQTKKRTREKTKGQARERAKKQTKEKTEKRTKKQIKKQTKKNTKHRSKRKSVQHDEVSRDKVKVQSSSEAVFDQESEQDSDRFDRDLSELLDD